MKIEFEPSGMTMARMYFHFNEQNPDPTDEDVLRHLKENSLVPKRVMRLLRDNHTYRVLTYGQCYLGSHLDALCEISGAVPQIVEGAL